MKSITERTGWRRILLQRAHNQLKWARLEEEEEDEEEEGGEGEGEGRGG